MDPVELKNTYNKIAQDYFDDHKKDDWDDDFVELFSNKLFVKAKVLDLGCGPGVETKKLSEKGLELYGFDLSDELLKIASQQVPSAHFVQGNSWRSSLTRTVILMGCLQKHPCSTSLNIKSQMYLVK